MIMVIKQLWVYQGFRIKNIQDRAIVYNRQMQTLRSKSNSHRKKNGIITELKQVRPLGSLYEEYLDLEVLHTTMDEWIQDGIHKSRYRVGLFMYCLMKGRERLWGI